MLWSPDISLQFSGGAVCKNANVWVISRKLLTFSGAFLSRTKNRSRLLNIFIDVFCAWCRPPLLNPEFLCCTFTWTFSGRLTRGRNRRNSRKCLEQLTVTNSPSREFQESVWTPIYVWKQLQAAHDWMILHRVGGRAVNTLAYLISRDDDCVHERVVCVCVCARSCVSLLICGSSFVVFLGLLSEGFFFLFLSPTMLRRALSGRGAGMWNSSTSFTPLSSLSLSKVYLPSLHSPACAPLPLIPWSDLRAPAAVCCLSPG